MDELRLKTTLTGQEHDIVTRALTVLSQHVASVMDAVNEPNETDEPTDNS